MVGAPWCGSNGGLRLDHNGGVRTQGDGTSAGGGKRGVGVLSSPGGTATLAGRSRSRPRPDGPVPRRRHRTWPARPGTRPPSGCVKAVLRGAGALGRRAARGPDVGRPEGEGRRPPRRVGVGRAGRCALSGRALGLRGLLRAGARGERDAGRARGGAAGLPDQPPGQVRAGQGDGGGDAGRPGRPRTARGRRRRRSRRSTRRS